MQNAIEVRSLTKRYRAFKLDGVSFVLPSGCIMGLIGENGAGKSTTIRLLLGLARRDGGEVSVLGEDPQGASRELRERIGVVFDDCPFPEAMTLRDVRRLLSAAYKRFNAAKFDSLGLRFALPERQKIKDYSRGMKMKLSIAAALSHGAELLILDEPTSGLDPGERVRFRNLLSEFARDRIVLISTHIVSDVEYIAAENAVMKDGKLIDVGTTEQLLRAVEGKVFTALVPDGLLAQAEREVRVVSLKNEGGGRTLVRYVADAPLLDGSEIAEPRLEDLYLWLFNDERRQEDV